MPIRQASMRLGFNPELQRGNRLTTRIYWYVYFQRTGRCGATGVQTRNRPPPYPARYQFFRAAIPTRGPTFLTMQAASNRSKALIAKRQLELRAQLWPELKVTDLWTRKESQGFTTIPRTMPLILAIMDALSKNRPVSSTYLDLWCRAFDECIVTLNKATEMAFYAGFTGQRAQQTWKGRVELLVELGFIKVQPGPSGPLSYAVILNPYRVIKRHHDLKTVGLFPDIYNALVQRATEIGATDLNAPQASPPSVPGTA